MEKGVTLKKCWEKQINQNKKENEKINSGILLLNGQPFFEHGLTLQFKQ